VFFRRLSASIGGYKKMSSSPPTTRIDKYLWAARFFKTRQLAIDAISAGRILVNDERIKPAKMVKMADAIIVRKPPYEWGIVVTGLAEKRGAAAFALTLYRETEASILARESLKKELKDMPPPLFPGRPTKKDRRTLEKFFVSQHAQNDSQD
jgi:ribosome-associated heat shock protein Hsp15